MGRNIEIKLELSPSEYESARSIAETLAGNEPTLIFQEDTFFHCPNGRLKYRKFADGSGELIAYERPDQDGPKLSRYIRAESDADTTIDALTMALGVRGIVKKNRELFLVGQTRVHLDNVEDLGTFLELEVVLNDGQSLESGEAIANELLESLRLNNKQLLSHAYIDLMEARIGQ